MSAASFAYNDAFSFRLALQNAFLVDIPAFLALDAVLLLESTKLVEEAAYVVRIVSVGPGVDQAGVP